MKETKYHIYLGVVNYTIVLNEQNKIESLKVGNDMPLNRYSIFGDKVTKNLPTLMYAFRCMIMDDPEQFEKLYGLLREHDPEMFAHAEKVVNEMKDFCLKLETVD